MSGYYTSAIAANRVMECPIRDGESLDDVKRMRSRPMGAGEIGIMSFITGAVVAVGFAGLVAEFGEHTTPEKVASAKMEEKAQNVLVKKPEYIIPDYMKGGPKVLGL